MAWKAAARHALRPRKPQSKPHVTRDARRAKGLCADCGERPNVVGILRCEVCRERDRLRVLTRSRANEVAGLCVHCSNPVFASKLCEQCWFKRSSSNNLGHTRGGEMLRLKFAEQQGRCWYTGRKLTPGVDASIDHTVSLARGGTNDPDNLRWVHIRVNEFKREMSEDEFFSICEEIITHRNRD